MKGLKLPTERFSKIIRMLTYHLKRGAINSFPLLVCDTVNHVLIKYRVKFLFRGSTPGQTSLSPRKQSGSGRLRIIFAKKWWYVEQLWLSSCSRALRSISFTFWWMVQTHTPWVPLAPTRIQCFGCSSANLENPICCWECFVLKCWYSSLRLHKIRHFWTCIRSLHWQALLTQNLFSQAYICCIHHSHKSLQHCQRFLGRQVVQDGGQDRRALLFFTSYFTFLAMKLETSNSVGSSGWTNSWQYCQNLYFHAILRSRVGFLFELLQHLTFIILFLT